MTRDRAKIWEVILYPDDLTHNIALDILEEKQYLFAGIIHDKDLDDKGELKKTHIHVLVYFQNQKDRCVLADELGIKDTYIRRVKSKRGAERYLVHADDPDKYQYSIDGILGSNSEVVKAMLGVKGSEADQIRAILAILDSMPVPCTYRALLNKCLDAGYYSSLRRMGQLLRYCVDEHNGLVGY